MSDLCRDAVVHESLRIHANTGVMLERVVPNDGYSIDGTWLPGGTVVGVNAWVIHQNEEIFGPDAASFNPERWLNISDEQLSQMKRHIFSVCIQPRFATALFCINAAIVWCWITKVHWV